MVREVGDRDRAPSARREVEIAQRDVRSVANRERGRLSGRDPDAMLIRVRHEGAVHERATVGIVKVSRRKLQAHEHGVAGEEHSRSQVTADACRRRLEHRAIRIREELRARVEKECGVRSGRCGMVEAPDAAVGVDADPLTRRHCAVPDSRAPPLHGANRDRLLRRALGVEHERLEICAGRQFQGVARSERREHAHEGAFPRGVEGAGLCAQGSTHEKRECKKLPGVSSPGAAECRDPFVPLRS